MSLKNTGSSTTKSFALNVETSWCEDIREKETGGVFIAKKTRRFIKSVLISQIIYDLNHKRERKLRLKLKTVSETFARGERPAQQKE